MVAEAIWKVAGAKAQAFPRNFHAISRCPCQHGHREEVDFLLEARHLSDKVSDGGFVTAMS